MNTGFTLTCNKCDNKIHVKDYDGSDKSIDEEEGDIKFSKYIFNENYLEIECKQCKNIISI